MGVALHETQQRSNGFGLPFTATAEDAFCWHHKYQALFFWKLHSAIFLHCECSHNSLSCQLLGPYTNSETKYPCLQTNQNILAA